MLKKVFLLVLVFTLILSFSSWQAFANINTIVDGYSAFTICYCQDSHEELDDIADINKEKCFVVFSEAGEIVFKLNVNVPDLNSASIFEVVGKLIYDKTNQCNSTNNDYQENTEIEPKTVMCCDRTQWIRYKLEEHSLTNPICYVDVYDFFYCNNCGAWYTVYKSSYSHLLINCPY